MSVVITSAVDDRDSPVETFQISVGGTPRWRTVSL